MYILLTNRHFILCAVICVTKVIAEGNNNTCKIQNGQNGECIDVKECISILKLYEEHKTGSKKELRKIKQYVLDNRCGTGVQTNICCPQKSTEENITIHPEVGSNSSKGTKHQKKTSKAHPISETAVTKSALKYWYESNFTINKNNTIGNKRHKLEKRYDKEQIWGTVQSTSTTSTTTERTLPQCRTPSGIIGQCVQIKKCDSIVSILQKPDKTQDDISFLIKSRCGIENNLPLVCCPKQDDRRCFTPNGREGTCVRVHNCTSLTNLLVRHWSKKIEGYAKNSRCDDEDRFSVCCDSEAPIFTNVRSNLGCISSAAPPDPTSECCGIENPIDKIIGGTAASIDQHPWLALIDYKNINSGRLLCGGTLISGKYVLTAAHCVTGRILSFGIPRSVRLGEYDMDNDGPDCVNEGKDRECNDGAQLVRIEQIIPHKNYDEQSRSHDNDIALIRLEKLVNYTDFIKPICLPTSDVTLNTDELRFVTAGWGVVSETKSRSNIKLYVDLPHVSKEVCQRVYANSSLKVKLGDGHLCSGGEKDKDTCKGDSGGPLMYNNHSVYDLVGIVSFGVTPCGIQGRPGIYTKVYTYLPWIRKHMKP